MFVVHTHNTRACVTHPLDLPEVWVDGGVVPEAVFQNPLGLAAQLSHAHLPLSLETNAPLHRHRTLHTLHTNKKHKHTHTREKHT